MFDSLGRLYRTKLVLACVLLAITGAVLIALGKRLPTGWASYIPLAELGGILVGAGILAVWLDAFMRREQAELDERRLRALLHEQAPAIRDAVLDGFAANHEDLKRVATPETLDRIITNGLSLRLNDQQFATEIYRDIRDQAVGAGERWHDASVSIDLRAPVSKTKAGSPGSEYLKATVRWEYRTTPQYPQRRFASVASREEYDELTNEPGATSAWFLGESNQLDPTSRESFELLRFSVNGTERPIRRSERKHGQTYTVAIGQHIITERQPVTVAYTYQVLVRRHGHLLFFDIEQPTRDLRIDLDYTNTGIDTISTLDLIPSTRHTTIETDPANTPPQTIHIDINGWVFPRSGIAFVWTLKSAAPPPRRRAPR